MLKQLLFLILQNNIYFISIKAPVFLKQIIIVIKTVKPFFPSVGRKNIKRFSVVFYMKKMDDNIRKSESQLSQMILRLFIDSHFCLLSRKYGFTLIIELLVTKIIKEKN